VGPPRTAGLALGAASEDEESVLRAFFRDGRLTEIPAKEAKRRIVLERIALEFEPGVEYDERTVNAIVGRFFATTPRSAATSSTRGSWAAITAGTGVPAGAWTPEGSTASRHEGRMPLDGARGSLR
jgi:hypothetical protein